MAEFYGEVMVSLLWTRVKLCGRINGVKVIIRLWMLVRLWVKGNRLSEDLLPLAEVCVFLLATCPSPLTPEVSNRPAWMVCDLSTDPSNGRGLLVPHRGFFGEQDLSKTKGSDYEWGVVSTQHVHSTTLLMNQCSILKINKHMGNITHSYLTAAYLSWNKHTDCPPSQCNALKCSLKWIQECNINGHLDIQQQNWKIRINVFCLNRMWTKPIVSSELSLKLYKEDNVFYFRQLEELSTTSNYKVGTAVVPPLIFPVTQTLIMMIPPAPSPLVAWCQSAV